MAYDGRAVANFILDHCDTQRRPISNLSMQKIIFFCHVWSLILLKQPLVKQSFEAWEFGPVLQYLYREFRGFDRYPIRSRATKLNPFTGAKEVVSYNFPPNTAEFLRDITDFYSQLAAGDLVELSHIEGGPWHRVWFHDGKVNPGMKIDNEEIATFYAKAPRPYVLQ